MVWDLTLDSHAGGDGVGEVDAEEYEIRVQLSNVSYTWEGVVGNSGPATGPNVQSSLDVVRSIAVAGGIGIVSVGYNEVHLLGFFNTVDEYECHLDLYVLYSLYSLLPHRA